ncbi:zinc-ribbon domain-containing protein [Maritimibacter dapengensis]|uniref:Zinc-ribbon domain-containing protein n=1 Tax=Maritimibacter dapengensis TaxID=2836868 RepID=A0ABS6SWW0_9RHOB|nr:zinc-ribbon domain-containing protein [Maritimibacter dapengensis]MBV7377405.1 zinc-ribbon domain-containing protein [Maritimibacter dapengensis]
MRLVCPNCGAQYEVDDRVIPDGGRDVQCSNCGHAWFQRPANWEEHRHDPEVTDARDETPAEVAESPPEVPSEDAPEPAVEAVEPPVEEEDPGDDTDEPGHGPEPRPRRELDENVRGILTEEADREIRARAAEGVETQPELGITEPDDHEEERRRIARERMARMRGIEEGETLEPEVPPPPPEPEPEPRPRKELFPDIEEINSTLDTPLAAEAPPETEQQTGEAQVAPVEKRGGFRRGFSLVILLAVIAFAIYILAPQIVESFPAAEPAIASYVSFVNGLLESIDGWMQNLIEKMEAAAGGEG